MTEETSEPIRRPRGPERLALVKALFERSRDERGKLAVEQFKKAYPDAPEKMIDAARFHIYVDGINAALDWLASAEIFLETGNDADLCSDTDHLIYHLYNWHQIQALMPIAKEGIFEIVQDMEKATSENDQEMMEMYLERLKDVLDLSKSSPKIRDW